MRSQKSKFPVCPRCKNRRMIRNGYSPAGLIRLICDERAQGGPPGCGYTTTDLQAKTVRDQKGRTRRTKVPIFKHSIEGKRVFVITSAQNATPRHAGFYAALEQCCNHRSAELLVIPTRYKNPTSRFTASQANEEVWDVPLAHLWNVRRNLNKNLTVLGDVKTQPTASSPLTGFEAMTHGESSILGHTKIQLKSVAVPSGRYPKLLMTTGACTVGSNYTDSRAGKLGEFHHTLAAVVVEIEGSKFHARHVNGDSSGEFYDLETLYSGATPKPMKALRPLSITFGDMHVRQIDPVVEKVTFGEIVKLLDPEWQVYHDLLDGSTVNPHTAANPFASVARHFDGKADVRAEVFEALQFVADRVGSGKAAIVPSNHDEFLQRWLVSTDWRQVDPQNRCFYLETALELVRAAETRKVDPERLSAFTYWARRVCQDNPKIRVLERDESLLIGRIEHGLHGDEGPNGARGSSRNLRRIGVRTNSGHAHSPEINEGNYTAGTSSKLRLGYNTGPSSWLNSHILTYANSKRTLIHIIDGNWRLA